MNSFHISIFPFKEIYQLNGNYFQTRQQILAAGHPANKIWSIAINKNIIIYGPSQHCIGVIGYIATNESHDCRTYYIKVLINSKIKQISLSRKIKN